MNRLGCHMSISKGLDKTIKKCVEIGADTFQFFPRNPRGSKSRDISIEEIEKFIKLSCQYDVKDIVCHGAYTMNLCSNKKDIRELAVKLINNDMVKLRSMGINKYVIHPGSHVKQGIDKGLDYIIKGLSQINVLNEMICIETMSGKGSELGSNIDEIKYIIDNSNIPLYVCIDTCHLFSSGVNLEKFDKYLDEFEEKIGINKIKVIHCNDSLMPFNSKKDRHERFGEGIIGEENLLNIIFNDRLTGIPIILETPNELDGHKNEITYIRGKYNEKIRNTINFR